MNFKNMYNSIFFANFKNANKFFNRYSEKNTDRTEIFDANVLIQLVIEENSIVISAEPTLAC